eukprot:TRINITY_DN2825_c0_g1_i3.p1 TRINITY_DN2825_c0_g1~~TRINITY_DN2825_c0_g1_i3.p1  ORF type:complete len:760 (-),score=156.03 TRINITY_DN2825_c0_g1_i3:132-2411(-)
MNSHSSAASGDAKPRNTIVPNVPPESFNALKREVFAGIGKPHSPNDFNGGPKQSTKKNTGEVTINKKPVTPGLMERRSFIVAELLDTERNYFQALQKIVEIQTNVVSHMEKLSASSSAGVQTSFPEVDTIFSNVRAIVPVNELLVQNLTKRFDNWTETTTIGDVLSQTIPFLKIYTTYNNNYELVEKALDVMYQVDWFAARTPHRLDLISLLVQPIQRIPRYRMLLEDLLVHTPDEHPDDKYLKEALVLIRQVAAHVNTSIRNTQNSEIMNKLGLQQLMAPHRALFLNLNVTVVSVTEYVGDCKMKSVNKPYILLVFNDVLAFVRVTSNTNLQPKPGKMKKSKGKSKKNVPFLPDVSSEKEEVVIWPLELVWCDSREEDKTGLNILGPLCTYGLTTENAKAKKSLLDAINRVVTECTGHSVHEQFREGRYSLSEHETYYGVWDLGRIQGYGCHEHYGTIYEGDFQLNYKQGHGVQQYLDGQLYKGAFASGCPHGKGESITLNGDVYIGDWVKGKREGKGTLTFACGDKYEGSWKANEPEGQGTLKLVNPPVVYEGTFASGKFHGNGSLTTPEGNYIGEFESGVKHGQGKMTFNDGREYTGSWKQDAFHGKGVLSSPSLHYKGEFRKGLFEGDGTLTIGDNVSTYTGQFKAGQKHGKGKESCDPQKSRYVSYQGEFSHNVPHGSGAMTLTSGDFYVGQFQHGQPHGTGKYVTSKGATIDGKWRDSTLDGKGSMLVNGLQVSLADDLEYLLPPVLPVFSFT